MIWKMLSFWCEAGKHILLLYNLLFCFVNREREMRIAARNEALQTATEQLQLKIQQKVKQANSAEANNI